jgi:hypothetical protein
MVGGDMVPGMSVELTVEEFQRLTNLKVRRMEIDTQIRAMGGSDANIQIPAAVFDHDRDPVACLRCGHSWTPRTQLRELPLNCARCHSRYWNSPPKPSKSNVRLPDDPPNPHWYQPKPRERTEHPKPILTPDPPSTDPPWGLPSLLVPPPRPRNTPPSTDRFDYVMPLRDEPQPERMVLAPPPSARPMEPEPAPAPPVIEFADYDPEIAMLEEEWLDGPHHDH